MRRLGFLILVLLALISCKKKVTDNLHEEEKCKVKASIKFTPPIVLADEEVAEDVISKSASDIVVSKVDKKKIIKDGEISIKVNDIEKSKKQVDSLVKSYNSYYDNEKLDNNTDNVTYNLKIRIPSVFFEKFISNFENGSCEITSKSINARDVTDQYIDVETRLENKKLYYSKYNELLKRANKVQDILDIQEKIRVLQEEIESTQGRLKYLNDQIAYSTLELSIFKEKDFKYRFIGKRGI